MSAWLEGSFVLSSAEDLDCYPALPPDGYELTAADSLGVAGLFALLGKLEMASDRLCGRSPAPASAAIEVCAA